MLFNLNWRGGTWSTARGSAALGYITPARHSDADLGTPAVSPLVDLIRRGRALPDHIHSDSAYSNYLATLSADQAWLAGMVSVP
jgi:hypothetical protein